MRVFLQNHGFQTGRDAFFALLSDRGLLVVKRKRKGCITTFSRHRYKKYPNLIKTFVPFAANQLWVSDITYIYVGSGFAYLSLITDAYSHKIVGFCLYASLEAAGPLKALKMALTSAEDVSKLIHHSDFINSILFFTPKSLLPSYVVHVHPIPAIALYRQFWMAQL